MQSVGREVRFESRKRSLSNTENAELILQPFLHINQNQPSRIFREFANALNYWLKVPEDIMKQINDIISVANINFFLMDDIQDLSVIRGGNSTAHLIYGTALTCKSINSVMLVILEKLKKLGHPDAIYLCRKCIKEVFIGVGMEMYRRDKFICPTVDEWLAVSFHKSATVFIFSQDLMHLFSKSTVDPTRLTILFGTLFHIRDDYCNLLSTAYHSSKGFAEDLTEGKFGFPSVHAINKEGKDGKVAEILRKRPSDLEIKNEYIERLKKLGSFEYTEKVLEDLKLEILKEMKLLGANPLMEKCVNGLCDWKTTAKVV